MSQTNQPMYATPLFSLPYTDKRKYSLNVYQDRVTIEGKYWYLVNKEFKKAKAPDMGMLTDYYGTDKIKKGSYKSTAGFVFAGCILMGVDSIIAFVNSIIDDANFFLGLIGISVESPPVFNIILAILSFACLGIGIAGLLKYRNMIVITFRDRRFCIPKKSVTKQEYNYLVMRLHQLAEECK